MIVATWYLLQFTKIGGPACRPTFKLIDEALTYAESVGATVAVI